jgi:hypothetical protein
VLAWGAPIPDFDQEINMPQVAIMVRKNQEGILIVDRTVHGEFENYRTPEQAIPKERSENPWESCITLGGAWGFVPNDKFKPAATVIHTLIEIVAKGGNLLLGVGPTAEGEFLPEQISRLNEIGVWMNKFGEAIYNFAQIIRRGIVDSEDKLYTHNNSQNNYVKRYLSFKEVPFNELNGTWYVLGRIHTTVNELRASAKDAGLYYKDNKGNKSFDEKQWEAIKAWTALNNGRKIGKKAAENLYKYVREIKDSDYRTQKFWLNIPDYQEFDFNDLREWAGLDMTDEYQSKAWWWILKRNFSPRQTIYFIRLLKRYGQDALNNEPSILIDTIHSVKGGEANNVLIYSKANWLSDFNNKSKLEKSDESRVYYTGVTRAKDTIHLLSTDYKYNYPIGKDYLVYLKENEQ